MNTMLFAWVRGLTVAMLFGGLIAGCAAPEKIGAGQAGIFERTGRFAVSVNKANAEPQAVQGGFAWLDNGRRLTLDLANPMGNTLARVTVDSNKAMLRHSDGRLEYAAHADGLVETVLGSPVPVAGLRDWLRGNTGDAPVQEKRTDDHGRLASFTQEGWRVKLSRYDALGPTLLQLNRRDAQGDISVRLAISAQPDAS